ncbi:predicted protein [Streptomyces sp. SPB78]|nr:predicted protein [Streptomyces sp. SPB78]
MSGLRAAPRRTPVRRAVVRELACGQRGRGRPPPGARPDDRHRARPDGVAPPGHGAPPKSPPRALRDVKIAQ